jgi:hypothetical protein
MNMNTKKKVKRIKFRISFIFLFALMCFITAFTLYMKNDEDLRLPGGIFESDKDSSDREEPLSGDGLVIITDGAAKKTGNPVPLSDTAPKSYIENCLFIGAPILSGLSDYDIAENADVITDSQINSGNLGKLLIKRGSENKTIKNIIMDEKTANIYIYLTPETELQTDALSDFCEDILSGNKSAQIYFISSLPGTDADKFNDTLLEFCNEAGVHYLDFNTAVIGNDGGIAAKYADGAKLSREGCQFLSEYILTHVAE